VLGSGVLVHVAANPGLKCRGEVDGNDQLQALWVFSFDACGLYNLPNLTLTHAGRTDPIGQITLRSTKGNVKVPAGSGMLLRVNGAPQSTCSRFVLFMRDLEGEGGSRNQRRQPYETNPATCVSDRFTRTTRLGARPNLPVVFDSSFLVRAGKRVDAASQSPTSGY
jgi:hypothetical protein